MTAASRPDRRRPWIDVVRDGLAPDELRGRGDTAVWGALRSTAMSAMQHGYGFPDWCATVLEPRSRLGAQVRVRVGRGDKPRSTEDVHRQLASAWDSAAKRVAESPAWSRDDVLAVVQELQDVLADEMHRATDAEAAVLAHALEVAAEKGTTRPALPRHAVVTAAARAGIGERAARTALQRLVDADVLRLVLRGRPGIGKGGTSGRAGLYQLPTAEALRASLCRRTRPMGPPQAQPHKPMGPQAAASPGPPAQTYGTPTSDAAQEAAVVTVTISAPDPETLAATLRAMQAGGVTVEQSAEPPAELRGNVVPIRHRANA
jgi:hypothetical protein